MTPISVSYKAVIAVALFVFLSVPDIAPQTLPNEDTRNAAGDKGSLHEFLDSASETLVALSMAEDQDTGEEQLRALLETHRALDRDSRISNYSILHLSVITGAPWFVHGVIRRGLAAEYSSPVNDDEIIVLFIDDLDDFSATVGVPVARRPSWLLVSPDGSVNWWERDRGEGTAEVLLERLAF